MKIDWWTLGLQAVNVLVLVWLLQRFLYRPVRQVLEQRRRQATELLEQSRAAQAELQRERAALEAERQELAVSRRNVEAQAQAQVEAERQRLLAAAGAEAAERARAARAALAAERQAVESALFDEAARLAVEIARRLLERLPRASLLPLFLDGICEETGRLRGAAAVPVGTEAELVSAADLDPAGQAQCRERLRAGLGVDTRLRFETDPALIAGLELRLPHAVVRNHWADDLARVRESLHAGDRPG